MAGDELIAHPVLLHRIEQLALPDIPGRWRQADAIVEGAIMHG